MNLRFFAVASIIALTSLSANVFAADAITVNAARAVINAAEAAAKKDDLQKSATYHSDDYLLKVSAPKSDGSREVIQKTRQQVVLEMGQWLKHVTDHHYESSAPTIAIVGGKAIARFHATESFTQDSKHFQGESNQVETVEMRNGRALITEADVQIVSLSIDGRRIF